MNTDTPETDSHYYPDFETGDYVVLADFARKLERERDDAREQRDNAREQRDRLEESILNLSHPNCKMLIRERDEAREQIQYNRKATLVIERMLYESREQRDRLAQALKQCREDSVELLAISDWWKNEPRGGYQKMYQTTRDNIDRADAVLESLTPNDRNKIKIQL